MSNNIKEIVFYNNEITIVKLSTSITVQGPYRECTFATGTCGNITIRAS